jgi:hypothetical protein
LRCTAFHDQDRNKETGRMFDLAMIALTCASFAILILYTYACDRM